MKIAFVQTRDPTDNYASGRSHILRSVRNALAERSEITSIKLLSILEQPRLGGLAAICAQGVGGIISAKPLPLQCLIFSDKRAIAQLGDAIERNEYDAAYLDSVRSYALLEHLRRRGCNTRIIVDMDDLMSRRMENLRTTNSSVSLGYLGSNKPFLQRLLGLGFVSRLIAAYEANSLRRIEKRIATLADAVVLISPVESSILRDRVEPDDKPKIHTIAPCMNITNKAAARTFPVKFCFIGNGELVQNRQTIAYLLDMWRTHKPTAELHIFGKQPSTPEVHNVKWRGFVSDMKEIYDSHTVALAPSFLKGGIKTKVAEAFAHGCPVIVNAISMEAFQIADYPLNLEHDAIVDLVKAPDLWRDQLEKAAILGQQFVALHMGVLAHRAAWETLVAGRPVAPLAVKS